LILPERARLAVVLVCLLVCIPFAADGATDDGPRISVHVTVVVSGNCLEPSAFIDLLHARSAHLREARADEPAPSMHIELRAGDDQFFGTLLFYPLEGPLRGQELRREVSGSNCESLAASLALVAAIIVDSGAPAVTGPTALPSSPPPARARSGERAASARSSRRSFRVSLGAALEGAVGLGPDLAIVPRAFLSLDLPAPLERVSVRLSFGRSYTQTVETPAGNAEITLTDIRFDPCFDLGSRATWRLGACGIVESGVLGGQGTMTNAPRSDNRTLTELGFGLRPTFLVGDATSFGLLAGGAVPLSRYRFYFSTPDTTAYRVPAWAALLEFSLGVRF
jgi:hypothetical protein